MKIVSDSRQHAGKHTIKNRWFEEHGHQLVVRALNFGDYSLDVQNPKLSIDTKRSVMEIAQNISRDHARFKRECIRARDAGARLVVLVENEHGYLTIQDVARWVNDECMRCKYACVCDPNANGTCENPRHKKSKKKPIQGPRLALAMQTMSERYQVEFMFCHPTQAAPIIASMLADEEARSERDC